MKKTTKITSLIIIFFLIIAAIIVSRQMMASHFKKKFSKKPPPGIIVAVVKNEKFSNKIESFGTALSKKTTSFRIKKEELLKPINFDEEVKKGDVIAHLKSGNIIAPFPGTLGKRGISEDTLGSEKSIILTLDDISIIFSDLKIPENYTSNIKKGLPVEVEFSGYKGKIYEGEVETVANRIDAQTRTMLVRVKIINKNSELIPGALLEVRIKYNERETFSIPDTSTLLEGNKIYVYKVLEDNTINKLEVETGIRNDGNLELISGLSQGDKIVAEGLSKVRPGGKIKPIIKTD